MLSFLVLPLVVLITFLALNYVVTKAALIAILFTLVVYTINQQSLEFLARIGMTFKRVAVRDLKCLIPELIRNRGGFTHGEP